MFAFQDQFVAMHRQSLESAQAIALASFSGLEKLTQLNVQAAKASLEEGVLKGVSLLETRDVRSMTESLSDSGQPANDKVTAYVRHVYEIASETGTEISKVVEKQINENHRQLSAAIDAMAKNAPAGSEGVVTLVRSAVTAANSAFDQVNRATRQAVEMTEANVANATNATRSAANAATRRKAA